jgi:hypothetical protein
MDVKKDKKKKAEDLAKSTENSLIRLEKEHKT